MFAINPEPMFYDWGDSTLVNAFFSYHFEPPLTLAELWMGAHPKGPSRLAHPKNGGPLGHDITLLDLIKKYPDEMLGAQWSTPDGKPGLPFLFKILSAGKALSIQAHPSLEQAKEGFDRENAQGVHLSSGSRNYKDKNHKPEAIFALGEFFALRGFRSPAYIVRLLSPIRELIPSVLSELENSDETKALKGFFVRLMDTEPSLLFDCFQQLLQVKGSLEDPRDPLDPYWWFGELYKNFPDDPGCFAPFYLEIFRLEPGQAMILWAGELHAYLKGIGIELMANSDNVLRAGCTSKHIDVPELLKVTRFEVNAEGPISVDPGEWIDGGFPEFRLLPLRFQGSEVYPLPGSDKPRIILGIEGQGLLRYQGVQKETVMSTTLSAVPGYTTHGTLAPARAFFVPPGTLDLEIVPDDPQTQLSLAIASQGLR